jgi:hypothetical protein
LKKRGEQAIRRGGVDARYPQPFEARPLSGQDRDRAGRNAECRRERAAGRVGGLTVDGRRRDPHLQRIAVAADDLRAATARQDVHMDDDATVDRFDDPTRASCQ